ncbi:Nif3-like dinuclear metal center hexameric protein [Endothiovibrio diazotrophicus]
MTPVAELIAYLDALLEADRFQDYCPNGLQVAGRREIRRIASGVTASEAWLERAIDWGADALLVHHGYFWKGEDPRVVGMKRRRLGRILAADANLIVYHLPLDAHPEVGNNARLARRLGLVVEGAGPGVGLHGRLAESLAPAAFAARIAGALGREPLHVEGGPARIERVAWCSGAAHSYLEEAAALGVDAYVSGEIAEHTVHAARELGVHYFAAGHHATEREGVQALADKILQQFDLEHLFIDVPNPV